ncbi:MDR family MFS transporter [Texcoconibacillus texcoconensis]|uniref:EmrB/QacA subfamily drug resistance transporter n=1 Tax=Texcoconibacillus texcoconensis TaxID=1095777 RepID=A0A840QMQ6_9BACI|nr:MDR family MFS transporter [Texcoconibacillus texcoconensis]MBB5172621.1 EmrB/QacA subfamily drug resistance transporter [Texcoconibacillus texcoconensis]
MKRIPHKWLVVISVLFGTFTVILNNSMLNPAIPHFMEVFDADAVSTGWVITIFMVMMGVTMPLTGYLGDKIGKKQLFIGGLSLFVIGSLLGSFSWNLPSLIAFRGLQGIGGGFMMPLSMALIFEVFPREERGLATGVWGIAAMMAPTIGPTLGGTIVEMGSWQWLFLCNIPTGILGIIFSAIVLKSPASEGELRFDLSGFVSVTIGVGAILVSLGRISELAHLQDPLNIILILIGGISLYIFIKIEHRKEQPLLDLSIFKVSAYSVSVWVGVTSSVSLFAGIFLIPLLIQTVYGYDAIVTGLIFLPAALLTGLGMTVGGRILDRKGPTLVVTSGLVIMTVGTLLFGFISMQTALWVIFALNAMRGLGMGLSQIPATTAGMNAIPEKFVSRGSAINNVFRQMSSALGIVFISVYFEVRRAHVMLTNGSIEEASLQAIQEGFILVAVLTFLSIPAGWLLGRKTKEALTEGVN